MNEQLEILIGRYLDGTASDAEFAALERYLGADTAAAGALFAAAHEEESLRDALASASSLSAPVIGSGGKWRACRRCLPGSRMTPGVRWAAVAACLLVAAAVGWRMLESGGHPSHGPVVAGLSDPGSPSPVVRVVSAGPGVSIENGRDGRSAQAAADAALGAADRIRTSAVGSAVLSCQGEEGRLTLGPSTDLTLRGDRQWELAGGELTCQVAHQPSRQPFVVATPQAQVRVVGTQFKLTLTRGRTRVEVSEGTVRVTRHSDGATVDVSAEQHVDVAGPDAAASPQRPVAPRGKDMGEFWSVNLRPAGISE